MIIPLLLSLLIDESNSETDLGRLRELRGRLGVRKAKDKTGPSPSEAGLALRALRRRHGGRVAAVVSWWLLYQPDVLEVYSDSRSFSKMRIDEIEHLMDELLVGQYGDRLAPLVPWLGDLVADKMDEDRYVWEQWLMGSPQIPGFFHGHRLLDGVNPSDRDAVLERFMQDRDGSGLPWMAQTLHDITDSSMVADISSSGRLHTLMGTLRTHKLSRILDYLEGTGTDISQYRPADWLQLLTDSEEWHDSLCLGRRFRRPIPDATVVLRWPDGATLQRLVTDADFRAEGESMGHCIGGEIDEETGYASGSSHFYTRSRDGEQASLSYRNPHGVPQATLTFTTAPDTYGVPIEVEGPRNGEIEDETAKARLAWYSSRQSPRPFESPSIQYALGPDWTIGKETRHSLEVKHGLVVDKIRDLRSVRRAIATALQRGDSTNARWHQRTLGRMTEAIIKQTCSMLDTLSQRTKGAVGRGPHTMGKTVDGDPTFLYWPFGPTTDRLTIDGMLFLDLRAGSPTAGSWLWSPDASPPSYRDEFDYDLLDALKRKGIALRTEDAFADIVASVDEPDEPLGPEVVRTSSMPLDDFLDAVQQAEDRP